MTVIIGLLCADGGILASDSQGTDLEAYVRIEVVSKLFPLGSHIAWGTSGPNGLQQVIKESLDEAARANWPAKALPQLRPTIINKIVGRQKEGLSNYVALPGTRPPELEGIVCGHTAASCWLLEITRDGQQEQHNKFCAVGSGKRHAYNLWGHLRHFEPHLGTVEIGKLIAYRIVHDVITNEAAFVGFPIKMWTIQEGGVVELPKAEVDGLGALMTGWRNEEKQSLRRFLEGLGPAEDAALDEQA